MNDHAAPGTANEPATRPGEGYFDSPARMKGRRAKPRRFFSKSRLTAVAATAALGVAVGGTAAYAATVPNGPTVQLGTYSIPGSAPQYTSGGDLLPLYNGTLGNPAAVVITGSGGSVTASSQVATVPNGSTGQAPGGTPAAQTWYFQRIGYVGATTPAMTSAGGTDMLAVPVYKIINYNTDGTHTCLEAYGVGDPNAGQAAESDVCDVNQVNQTNQLWIVGSPAQANATMNATTGTFDGSSPQIYSSYLQGSATGASGLSDSVIENVAGLEADGWNTSQAPALHADPNSPLTLKLQDYPVTSQNATWNIVPASDLNVSGSSGQGSTGQSPYVVGVTPLQAQAPLEAAAG